MTLPRSLPSACCLALLGACWSGAYNKESADDQVYAIVDHASEVVTGSKRPFTVERPVDTLRKRLIAADAPVRLTLAEALDVAAENSRDFQRQKETLYLAGLNLTRSIYDFSWQFDLGATAEISGNGDETADAFVSPELAAAATSAAGTRVVTSFVNTFLRSVIAGGKFDGSSILNMAFTQPLLRGSGRRIVREPLTQAERDVIYAMRGFERFRAEFAIGVVGDYWDIARQMADLDNVEANYRSLVETREQTEELYNAGRRTIIDLNRAQQSEYTADNQRVLAKNRLQTSLDAFKLRLGLPIRTRLDLDRDELSRVARMGVTEVDLDESRAIDLALGRRLDHRTVIDEVEDAGRRIEVSEDALNMSLDFTAALSVPAQDGKGLNLDWSRVNWAAGFQLDLAIDKLPERNAYRAALIAFDAAIRARELSEDSIGADVRGSLRDIRSAMDSYRIQSIALDLARTRVDATTDLYNAGRIEAREKLDAQDALLQAQLDQTAAILEYAVARLELMNDLEAIMLPSTGLQFDRSLPLPQDKAAE